MDLSNSSGYPHPGGYSSNNGAQEQDQRQPDGSNHHWSYYPTTSGFNPQVSSLGSSSLNYAQQLPSSRPFYGRYDASASSIPPRQSYSFDLSAHQVNTLQGALGQYPPMSNQQHMSQLHQPGAGSAGSAAAPQFYPHNASTTSMPSSQSFPQTQRQQPIDYHGAAVAAAPRYGSTVGTESPSDLGKSAHSQSVSPAMPWSAEDPFSIASEPSQQKSYRFTAQPLSQPAGIPSGSRHTNAAATATSAPPKATSAAAASVSVKTASPPRPTGPKRKTQQQTRSAGSSAKQGRPTKRPKTGARPDSETDSEDDGSDGGRAASKEAGEGTANGNLSRPSGACSHCKKLKMRCEFPEDENICKRCKSTGHTCVVEGRKPRTAPNKREFLLAQIKQKDMIIESLLKQLHNPYLASPLSIRSRPESQSPSDGNNMNINAWLDKLQASVRTAGDTRGEDAFRFPRETSRMEPDASDTEEGEDNLSEGDTTGDADQDERKLHEVALPDSTVPFGLLANLSLSASKAKQPHASSASPADVVISEEEQDDVGVANETYFMPGPATDLSMRAKLIDQHALPDIIVHNLVTPQEVDKLFQIYFSKINIFVTLLDPEIHTPTETFQRCPFLFTVICAISSRYYPEKAEIYPVAMRFAKHAAANALIDGWKSVELCQAYILMSVFAVPARRWEEDRSWLYTGLAIRLATDLNLHQATKIKPTSEKQEREILNRARAWMICCNIDRSTATQMGKPASIKEDLVLQHPTDWYKKSKYNQYFDIHLCAYSELLRIVSRFHEGVTASQSFVMGGHAPVDIDALTAEYDEQLINFERKWEQNFHEFAGDADDAHRFRRMMLPFVVNYSRLVIYQFKFQQTYVRPGGLQLSDQPFFDKCLNAAKACVEKMAKDLARSGYMKYSPDGYFTFAAFGCAFLLKLLKPEFEPILSHDQGKEIFDLIGELIRAFTSPDIVIDERHTPKLYARFLWSLVSRHRRDGATSGRLHTAPPPQSKTSFPTGDNGNNVPPPGTSMTSTFSMQLPSMNTSGSNNSGSQDAITINGGGGGGGGGGNGHQVTPVYRPEMRYLSGMGPIDFGVADTDMALTDDELPPMANQLIDPAWWQHMMMPGYSWPSSGTNNYYGLAQSVY